MPDILQCLRRLAQSQSVALLALPLFLTLSCGGGGVETTETPVASAAVEATEPVDVQQATVPERVEPPGVHRVRADDVITSLADTLEQGHQATAETLRKAKLDGVVNDILSMDGYQLHDVSADTLLLEVYRRAEAHTKGQGERVLAYLYKEAEAEFGAVKTDPAFAPIREIATQIGPDFDPRTFRFASAEQASAIKVSKALEGAIQQLAYVYAQPNLSQLRGLALRHFRKPGFSFDRIVAESSNTRDAIVRMFEQGTPPPRAEVAGEAIMRETLDFSGALRSEKAFLDSIEELRSELGLERLDPELRSYAAKEDEIPSRRAQVEQADSASLRGKIARPESPEVLSAARQARLDADRRNPARPSPARQKSAQEYSNYVSVSFEPPPDSGGAPSPPGPGGGGGGGGGRPGVREGGRPAWDASRSYRTGPPPRSYRARSSGPPPVARTYRTAIRSARAGRGVSVGASVADSLGGRPTSAAWITNREDGRFGRLVVQMTPASDGPPFLAVSRTLFEDSFYAAASVIGGGHFGSTAFREGHILVIMSMDPFAETPERQELGRKEKELNEKVESVAEDDFNGQLALLSELLALSDAAQKLPRRVVVHPALFGRELAWSAVRTDFWLNDREGLSREAAITNGGKAMPDKLLNVDLTGAGTWQFFERDSEVLMSSGGKVRTLSVRSTGPEDFAPSERSHFALSIFGVEEGESSEDEAELPRLQALEVQLQPMLDWLATNHHDFMRLNDFSEGLTLMRWLKKNRVVPLLVDMDGEAPDIATPDRIVLGEGPRVR